MDEQRKYEIGDRVETPTATYEIERLGYVGPLPLARIVSGPNVGIPVILTTAGPRGGDPS
jgi:hypothetical protein